MIRATRGERLVGCTIFGSGGSAGIAGANSGDLSQRGSSPEAPTLNLPTNQDPLSGNTPTLMRVAQRDGVVCLFISDNSEQCRLPLVKRTARYIGAYEIAKVYSTDKLSPEKCSALLEGCNQVRAVQKLGNLTTDEEIRLYTATAKQFAFRLVPILPDLPTWFTCDAHREIITREWSYSCIDESAEGCFSVPVTQEDRSEKACIRPGTWGKTIEDIVGCIDFSEYITERRSNCSEKDTSDPGISKYSASEEGEGSDIIHTLGVASNEMTMLSIDSVLRAQIYLSACTAARVLGSTLCNDAASKSGKDETCVSPVRSPPCLVRNCTKPVLNLPLPASLVDLDATSHMAQVSTLKECCRVLASSKGYNISGPAPLLENFEDAHISFFKSIVSVIIVPSSLLTLAKELSLNWEKGEVIPSPDRVDDFIEKLKQCENSLKSAFNTQFTLPEKLKKLRPLCAFLKSLASVRGRRALKGALQMAERGIKEGRDGREAARKEIKAHMEEWVIGGLTIDDFVSHVFLRTFETVWSLPFGEVATVWPGYGAKKGATRIWIKSKTGGANEVSYTSTDQKTATADPTRTIVRKNKHQQHTKLVRTTARNEGGTCEIMRLPRSAIEAIEWVYQAVLDRSNDSAFLAAIGLESDGGQVFVIDHFGKGIKKPFSRTHAEHYLCKIFKLLSIVNPTRTVSLVKYMDTPYTHPIYLSDEGDRKKEWMRCAVENARGIIESFERLVQTGMLPPLDDTFDYGIHEMETETENME